MDDDAKNKKKGSLVETTHQAKRVFELVFAEKNLLQKQLFLLLKNINNPVLLDLFDQFPALLSQYDLKRLLAGEIEVAYGNAVEVQQACLLGSLQSLLLGVEQLLHTDNLNFSEDQLENIDVKMIKYIANSMPLREVSMRLSQIVRFAVGGLFYDEFRKSFFTVYSSLDLSATAQRESVQLMLWLGAIRIFLEALDSLISAI